MRLKKFSFIFWTVLSAVSAQAGSVLVTGNFFDLSRINRFYNSIGATSTIGSGTLDTLDLSSVDLLWAVQPAQPYTAAELLSMHHYLERGGRIAFMGEHGTFRPNENLRINNAISFLGGHIEILNISVDCGVPAASRLNGNILTNPLTEGVDEFEYTCIAPLMLSAGAQALMRGQDDPNDVIMAYETIGAGSIFVLADENGWDNQPTAWASGADNARLFANLVPVGAAAVPEPSTYGVVGVVGLVGMVLLRRARWGKRQTPNPKNPKECAPPA